MTTDPTSAELRLARERLDVLLQRKAPETEWQRLFAECPFVLSRALPLKLTPGDIVPLGRPGKDEPDVVFEPRTSDSAHIYGVIELKGPGAPVVVQPRKGVIRLSGDAATAKAQALRYSEQMSHAVEHGKSRALFLGGKLYTFVVMGIASDTAAKLHSELLKEQAMRLLSTDVRFIHYDELVHAFSLGLPQRVFSLSPTFGQATSPSTQQALSLESCKVLEGASPKGSQRVDLMLAMTRVAASDLLKRYYDTKENEDLRRLLDYLKSPLEVAEARSLLTSPKPVDPFLIYVLEHLQRGDRGPIDGGRMSGHG